MPPVKICLLTVARRYFLWIICVIVFLVNVMLLRLFIAALWSPVEKGLTWRLLFVMFIAVSLLSHV